MEILRHTGRDFVSKHQALNSQYVWDTFSPLDGHEKMSFSHWLVAKKEGFEGLPL